MTTFTSARIVSAEDYARLERELAEAREASLALHEASSTLADRLAAAEARERAAPQAKRSKGGTDAACHRGNADTNYAKWWEERQRAEVAERELAEAREERDDAVNNERRLRMDNASYLDRIFEQKNRAEAAEARESVLRDALTLAADRLRAAHCAIWAGEARAALSPEPAAQEPEHAERMGEACPFCGGKRPEHSSMCGLYSVDEPFRQPAAPRESERERVLREALTKADQALAFKGWFDGPGGIREQIRAALSPEPETYRQDDDMKPTNRPDAALLAEPAAPRESEI